MWPSGVLGPGVELAHSQRESLRVVKVAFRGTKEDTQTLRASIPPTQPPYEPCPEQSDLVQNQPLVASG